MQTLAYAQLAELESRHWWFRARRKVCVGLLREHLSGTRPRRILDLGAGVGGFLDELASLGDEVCYTELRAELIRASRERGHERGLVASAEALPFRTASFDLVCLFDVLEHVEDEARALAEIRRVLAPGGTLFLHVPAHQILFANNDRQSGHHRRYGRRRLRRALAGAGFTVARLTFTNALLFPLIAPLVLGLRCFEELGLAARKRYTNLSWSNPPFLARALESAFACELHLSRRCDLPLGHSLAAIART
jgi:SAM-dependent methyltransferase